MAPERAIATVRSVNLAPNVSLGQAVRAVERARQELGMPASIQAGFQGTAKAFRASLANEVFLVLAAIITVYILLGVLCGSASRAGLGDRIGAAPAARHCHRRRVDLQPDADAVHDARDLPRVRSPGATHRPAPRPAADGRARSRRGRMSLSSPFIHRPIATTLLTVAIALSGAIAYKFLPVSPLPQVEFPTISVQAGLPG